MPNIIEQEKQFHIQTYGRWPVEFVRGRGKYLWDKEDKKYLDFVCGLGVTSIGHCHPKVVKAACEQLGELIHTSNLYYTKPQVDLAKKLVEISFGQGKCFFANSGAEANEGAVKLARKYAKQKLGITKPEIITAFNSFHGRTLKMLAATGQPEKQKAFEPLPPGFVHVPLNDIKALKQAINENTCAIMLEPIQGEGGVIPCDNDYLIAVYELCQDKGLLLILDEIQTGFGRTGKMFAYQHLLIEPDILTVAKALGNGLPIGAFIAKEEISAYLGYGDHGTTYGGGPVVCMSALATLEVMQEKELVEKAAVSGDYLFKRLVELEGYAVSIRGKGLMVGIELKKPIAKEIVKKMMDEGILVNNIGDNIIRMLPPLIIEQADIDKVVDALLEILK
ncbi:MAG: acetylornithine transaminase [Actinobacteria bacterium]|nr:MAG: acetylornithine transaminase [Actinomycetota bacterium]